MFKTDEQRAQVFCSWFKLDPLVLCEVLTFFCIDKMCSEFCSSLYTCSFFLLNQPPLQQHCLAYVLTDKNGKGIEQNPNLKMFWWNSHLDKTIVFCLIHLMKDTSGHHCPPHSRKVVGLFPGAWWGLSVKRLHALPVLWVLSSYSGFLPQSRVLWGTMCRCCDWMVVCLFMQPSDKLFSCLGFNCLCPKTTRAILVALPHPASWNKTFINTLLVKIHTFKKKCFWNHSWQP